ncbi:MAG: transporter substrate-binding domain-containing protein [Clostridia bacterium]|nr:transporter substrate-binding domain-containing protein [Clostridia bacterium]
MMVAAMFASCGSSENTDAGKADNASAAATDADTADTKAADTSADTEDADAALKDIDKIVEKGKIVVGITDYAPMNYKDENDEWTGFDTEFAQAFAAILGVDVEFVEIDWDNKWFALESGNVDCIWNGMTITEEAKLNADVSDAYVMNNQVLVTKTANVKAYTEPSAVEGEVAVEAGSAGQSAAEDAELNAVEYPLQSDALLAVESGKAVACVIDKTMADAMTGEGTDYDDLSAAFALTEEEYGVAFRKGSDLLAKFNDAIASLKDDGTLPALAEEYKLTLAD